MSANRNTFYFCLCNAFILIFLINSSRKHANVHYLLRLACVRGLQEAFGRCLQFRVHVSGSPFSRNLLTQTHTDLIDIESI